MTRDNMLDGDTGASGLARALKRTSNPPAPLRIRISAYRVNFEGLVVRAGEHLRETRPHLRRSVDLDRTRVRNLAANGLGGETYRTNPLDDQWELYDLTEDPIEADNRWTDPDLDDLRRYLKVQLKQARAESIPERNNPWPYVRRESHARRRRLFFG